MNDVVVYLVHCIDAEGPLCENSFSFETLLHRPKNEVPLPDYSDFWGLVQSHRARTLGTFEQIARMVQRVTSNEERFALRDSFGGGWIFNWFCMDHIDFRDNPRQRAMGVHAIFDFYSRLVTDQNRGDSVHWHFHPMSNYREAHRCASSYQNSPQLLEILCRRVLERRWFPKANRAGFQDERPDSHWFLEQWIPFDLSNTSTKEIDPELNPDLVDGRFADWRWAPSDWRTYHPHHDCYQLEGQCRRKIARCLNLINRFANLNEAELTKAFERARGGHPTLVAMASHDWRDMAVELAYVRHLISLVAPRFPEVKFKFSDAVEAFNAVHPPEGRPPVKLSCSIHMGPDGRPRRVAIRTDAGRVFGPQPFFAVCTRSKNFIHDNLNYGNSLSEWNYAFDEDSIAPDDVRLIGVAANDDAGHQSIHVIDVDDVRAGGDQTKSF